MAYRALYRQWRPKDFSHMVGQQAIVNTLRNQVIHERIAHAYLFCGSRGTGKTSTAKILAKAINCMHPENGDPCGECANCLRMDQDESLDIIEIDAASNNGVDEMRDLRDTVKYPPQFGKYKVYIIDEVHMLSTSAFNALLKTLEEPPAHIVFILATTEPQKLPETILSRCQRFDFGRISTPEIAGRLREAAKGEGAEVSDGALMAIARAAEGGLRDALSILDMCLGYGNQIDEAMVRRILGTSDRSFLFRFSEALAEQDSGTVFRMIDELIRDGKDPGVFARDVSNHFRCLLLTKSCPDETEAILDLTSEDAREFRDQAGKYTVTRMMKILDLYMALETDMRFSSSPRLALENVSLKCCLRTDETDAQALNDRITELERKIDDLNNKVLSGGFSTVPPNKKDVNAGSEEKSEVKAVQSKSATKVCAVNTSVWETFMNQAKKSDPGSWSILMHGHITGTEDNVYTWTPNTEKDDFFLAALNTEQKKKIISEQISSLAGASCRFETARRSSSSVLQEDDPEKKHINMLYDTFGKEPVVIVDKL